MTLPPLAENYNIGQTMGVGNDRRRRLTCKMEVRSAEEGGGRGGDKAGAGAGAGDSEYSEGCGSGAW